MSENEAQATRGKFLTTMTFLFALLAISNATKPLQNQLAPPNGLVVFGVRFESFLPNMILGPVFALALAVYARGLWRMRAWVLPLAMAYAFYVPTNLVLFWYLRPDIPRPAVLGIVVYLFFALGGSIGTALYLCWHRDRLR